MIRFELTRVVLPFCLQARAKWFILSYGSYAFGMACITVSLGSPWPHALQRYGRLMVLVGAASAVMELRSRHMFLQQMQPALGQQLGGRRQQVQQQRGGKAAARG